MIGSTILSAGDPGPVMSTRKHECIHFSLLQIVDATSCFNFLPEFLHSDGL